MKFALTLLVLALGIVALIFAIQPSTRTPPPAVGATPNVRPHDEEYDFPSSSNKKWLVEPETNLHILEQALERFSKAGGVQAYSTAAALLWPAIATILDAQGRFEYGTVVTVEGQVVDSNWPPKTRDTRHAIHLQDRIYRFAPGEFPEYDAVCSAKGDPLKGEVFPPVMPPELILLVESRAKEAIEVLRAATREK